MAEQQLVDYIKRAKDAGQSDNQSRTLLYKNGWTEAEVNDAFVSLNQAKLQSQIQPDLKGAPQVVNQSEIKIQPQVVSHPQPQIQPQSTATTQQNNMLQRKTVSHLVLKILMVLIIIVVLSGAGLFIAGQYFNFSWNPFSKPSPEIVISNMFANMKNVKSSHTTTQVEIVATDNDSKISLGKLAFNTNSEADIININDPKVGGNFTINLTLPGSVSPIASSIVSTAVIDNAFYFKINNIIVPDTFSYPGLDLSGLDISKIKGNWFKVDRDSIKALCGQIGVADITQIDISDLANKIQDLLSTENILSVDKQLKDEVISGQDTYHYLLTISKEKLKGLADKTIALGIKDVAKAQAFANTFVDTMGDVNIEMWIGKKDFMLYKFGINKVIDSNKIYSGTNMQLEIKFNMANSNFNKPISVQSPVSEGTPAQKIEDIALPLLKTQKIESDMSQIGFTAQSVFSINKSYYSLCKSGLLNGYLKMGLLGLSNDIVSQGAKIPTCFAGIQDYCVSTQLADGSYLCIDKNNILGKMKCVSYRTACK